MHHDLDARSTSVVIDGVVAIRLGGDEVELRVDGQTLRVTRAQAQAIAAAVLELARIER
jgi:hypothetical protein